MTGSSVCRRQASSSITTFSAKGVGNHTIDREALHDHHHMLRRLFETSLVQASWRLE